MNRQDFESLGFEDAVSGLGRYCQQNLQNVEDAVHPYHKQVLLSRLRITGTRETHSRTYRRLLFLELSFYLKVPSALAVAFSFALLTSEGQVWMPSLL